MAAQVMIDKQSSAWAAVAALSSGLVVTAAVLEQPPTRPRRIAPSECLVALVAEDVTFAALAAPSGSVFGATAEASPGWSVRAHPMIEQAEDEPLFVQIAAPIIRARARVRAVVRSPLYEGRAFHRDDDDEA